LVVTGFSHGPYAVIGAPFYEDIWEGIKDVATSDTFYIILGSVVTAGSYGWLSGIANVTSVQTIALQEGMKAVAGGAARAAQTYLATGQVVVPGFVEAWTGQVAYRTRAMIASGGAVFAAQAAAGLAALIDPGTLQAIRDVYEKYDETKTRYEESEQEVERKKKEYLDELERVCLARISGPIDPNATVSTPKTICRRDMLAQAANLANGREIFDTSSWNPLTGDPYVRTLGRASARTKRLRGSNLSSRTYTAAELDQLAEDAETRGMSPAIVSALRTKYERARLTEALGPTSSPIERIDLAPQYTEAIERQEEAGRNAISRLPTSTSKLGPVALIAAIFSSPLWLPRLLR